MEVIQTETLLENDNKTFTAFIIIENAKNENIEKIMGVHLVLKYFSDQINIKTIKKGDALLPYNAIFFKKNNKVKSEIDICMSILGENKLTDGIIVKIEYEILSEEKFKERGMNFNEAIFFEKVELRDMVNKDISFQILNKTFDQVEKNIILFVLLSAINNATSIEIQARLEQNAGALGINISNGSDYANLFAEKKINVADIVFRKNQQMDI